MKTRPASQDWSHSSAEEIEAGIARTRERLEDHLERLRSRFAPSATLRKLVLPAGLLAAGAAAGFLAWKMSRTPAPHGLKGKVSRLKVRTAGIREQMRALRLLFSVVRKGKPAVFVVEGRRA